MLTRVRDRRLERLTDEIEGNFAEKNRRVWTVIPNVKQLREGERDIYQNADGQNYFVTRIGDELYYSALFQTPSDMPGIPWYVP
jgi:hypothetical protein